MSQSAHAEVLSAPPVLTLVNNQPRTLSTDVAAYFGKEHKVVMRQLRNLLDNCDPEWGRCNFAPSSYINEQGKEQPCYNMTRDGFTLLAMGFTGPKAVQFKISYIEAFNAMEAELAGRARDVFTLTGDGPRALDGPSDVKTRRPLTNLINTWVSLAPISYRDAWHQVKGHFQVEKAENLTLDQVREACAWVQERLDRLARPPQVEVLQPGRATIAETVLAVLKRLGPSTIFQLREAAGLTILQVEKALGRLRDKGLAYISSEHSPYSRQATWAAANAGPAKAPARRELPAFDPTNPACDHHPQERYLDYADFKYQDIADATFEDYETLAELTGDDHVEPLSPEVLETYHFLAKFEDLARAFPNVLKGFTMMERDIAHYKLQLAKAKQALPA